MKYACFSALISFIYIWVKKELKLYNPDFYIFNVFCIKEKQKHVFQTLVQRNNTLLLWFNYILNKFSSKTGIENSNIIVCYWNVQRYLLIESSLKPKWCHWLMFFKLLLCFKWSCCWLCVCSVCLFVCLEGEGGLNGFIRYMRIWIVMALVNNPLLIIVYIYIYRFPLQLALICKEGNKIVTNK